MFEKLAQVAEQAATSASRRQFFGRIGQGTLAMAAALGGLLGLPDEVQAGRGRAALLLLPLRRSWGHERSLRVPCRWSGLPGEHYRPKAWSLRTQE
jgi:hypothetical protein